MNLLTALVCILWLGSLNCGGGAASEIEEHCKKQENVGEKEIKDLDDMTFKCYTHCIYEKKGKIRDGKYVGNHRWCQNVRDDNKCELAFKVSRCEMLKGR